MEDSRLPYVFAEIMKTSVRIYGVICDSVYLHKVEILENMGYNSSKVNERRLSSWAAFFQNCTPADDN